MSWLESLKAMPGDGFTPRQYVEGGRSYGESLSGGARTEAYEIPGVAVGYVGMDTGPWFQGKKAQTYDTEGRLTGEFEIPEFKADIGEKLAIGLIAAIAAAGAYSAFTGGVSGSASGAVASGQAGPVLSKAALDGTTAFGANSVAGAYSLAGTGAAAAGSAGAASAGGSLSGALGSIKTALGIATAAGGLTGGGTSPGGSTPYTTTTTTQTTPTGVNPLVWLAGAAVLAVALLGG